MEKYKCPSEDCFKEYSTKGALYFHMRQKHPNFSIDKNIKATISLNKTILSEMNEIDSEILPKGNLQDFGVKNKTSGSTQASIKFIPHTCLETGMTESDFYQQKEKECKSNLEKGSDSEDLLSNRKSTKCSTATAAVTRDVTSTEFNEDFFITTNLKKRESPSEEDPLPEHNGSSE